jgi:hypothetical protein
MVNYSNTRNIFFGKALGKKLMGLQVVQATSQKQKEEIK